jgi:cell wall-associated NlpC family hydrolase
MAIRADIVAAARGWIGVPWRHQGRSRAGVDCVGLIVVVCRELGLSDYDSTVYGRDPDPTRFLGHFTAGGATRINPLEARNGDLLVFRQSAFRFPVSTLKGGGNLGNQKPAPIGTGTQVGGHGLISHTYMALNPTISFDFKWVRRLCSLDNSGFGMVSEMET